MNYYQAHATYYGYKETLSVLKTFSNDSNCCKCPQSIMPTPTLIASKFLESYAEALGWWVGEWVSHPQLLYMQDFHLPLLGVLSKQPLGVRFSVSLFIYLFIF